MKLQDKRIKISYEMHLISTLFKQQNNLSNNGLQTKPQPHYLIKFHKTMQKNEVIRLGDCGHSSGYYGCLV